MTVCPRCGEPSVGATSTSPGIETFVPCGCRIAIDGGSIQDDSDERGARSVDDTEQSPEERVEPFVVHEMRFADHHKDAILNDEKTLTVRLADEWRSLCANDGLGIIDESGERFAEAVVKRAKTFPTKTAFHIADYHSGHGGYGGDLRAFVDEMTGYYPDASIAPDTELKVIHFGLIAPSSTGGERDV